MGVGVGEGPHLRLPVVCHSVPRLSTRPVVRFPRAVCCVGVLRCVYAWRCTCTCACVCVCGVWEFAGENPSIELRSILNISITSVSLSLSPKQHPKKPKHISSENSPTLTLPPFPLRVWVCVGVCVRGLLEPATRPGCRIGYSKREAGNLANLVVWALYSFSAWRSRGAGGRSSKIRVCSKKPMPAAAALVPLAEKEGLQAAEGVRRSPRLGPPRLALRRHDDARLSEAFRLRRSGSGPAPRACQPRATKGGG